jgi:cytochrome c5
MHEHHPDAIETNIETHPVKLAIGIALGAVAMIVGIILLVQFAIGIYAGRSTKGDPAMSDEAVTQRIAPVAKLAIDPNAKAPEPAKPAAAAPGAAAAPVAAPPPATAKVAAAGDGKKTYDITCSACHGTGVAGAPKLGDKAAWAPRLKPGKEALYAAVLKGKGAMPPKGGNMALADDAAKAAVDYMVDAAR